MANLRDQNIKRYGDGEVTGDPSSGGTYVDGQGHVHYMSPEDARKSAGFGTFADKLGDAGLYGSMGLLGAGLATGGAPLFGLGAVGGAPAAGASGLGADVASTMAVPGTIGTGATAATTGAGALASKGLKGWLGKLDPTTLLFGGLSLLGGNQNPFQMRHTFEGSGISDPKAALQHSLHSIYDMENEMKQPVPVRQRQQYADVSPVSVPGLGFQIGGALGQDPAINGQLAQEQLTSPDVKKRTPQNG